MSRRAQPPAQTNQSSHRPASRGLTQLAGVLFGDLYHIALLVGMGIYTWVFSGLAIAQHQGMRTHKADMGQIDQAIWNSSRGRFVEMTDFGFLATRMTDHVEPVLAYISPIYWLWDDTRAILILQTVFVAGGAWLLYHFTLQQFMDTLPRAERDKVWHSDTLLGLARPVALGLALAYLLAPPLQAAVLTEFHAVPLVVPMVLWALWAVGAQRWGQFAVALLLVATVKEETALLAAGLGVWAIWRMAVVARWDPNLEPPKSHRPLFLVTGLTAAALVWFYVATFVIVPYHAKPVYGIAESGYFARYGALGDSPADILRSFFTQPGLVWAIATEPVRADYLRRLLMPFGYLSLFAPDVILLALPVLLANQLSAYPAQYYGEYHYSAPVIVYFAAAAAVGAARLWRMAARPLARSSGAFQHLPAANSIFMNLAAIFQNSRTALRPLLSLGLALWFVVWGGLSYLDAGRGPGGPRLDATPVTAHHRLISRFTAQIPPDARVTATAAVHPHVSHRRFVYQFPLGLGAPTPIEEQADWALLNVTMAIDMAPGDLRARVEEMLAGEWGVVDGADGFLLLRKGAPDKTIPPAFFTFAQGALAPHAQGASASGPADLLHMDLIDRPYWRATQIVSTWRIADDPPQPDATLGLSIHHPDGRIIDPNINATAPALAWLPSHSRPPGQTLRIASLPHYLPAVWGVVQPDQASPLIAAYVRGPQDQLRPLPTHPQRGHAAQIAAALELSEQTQSRFAAHAALSDANEPAEIHLRAWTTPTGYAGRELHVLLEWELAQGTSGEASWPSDLSVFVHLRAGEENRSQADGEPRYFVANPAATDGLIWDWRSLALPDDAHHAGDAPWTLVVGLYNRTTGQRAQIYDADGRQLGNEQIVGTLYIQEPPWPDQTCALIPDTCWSQPLRP